MQHDAQHQRMVHSLCDMLLCLVCIEAPCSSARYVVWGVHVACIHLLQADAKRDVDGVVCIMCHTSCHHQVARLQKIEGTVLQLVVKRSMLFGNR